MYSIALVMYETFLAGVDVVDGRLLERGAVEASGVAANENYYTTGSDL